MARSRNRFYRGGNVIGPLRRSSRLRQRAARSYTTGIRRKNKVSTGQGVTTQHDARLIYRKKNMPRRKKSAWRKFRSKVLAVAEKDLGTQTAVFNKLLSVSNIQGARQVTVSFALYGLRSDGAGGSTHYNDLKAIATVANGADQSANAGLTLDPTTKFLFQSAVLDVTIRNRSTENNVPAYLARMEVDVYECMVGTTTEETGATYKDFETLLAQNPQQTRGIGGTTSECEFNRRGCTPWDMTYALSRFRIKILRKTKYQIANGDQVTYQVRDPGRHVFQNKYISGADGFNHPGLTRVIFIVGKLSPGLTIGDIGTPGVYQERLDVGITRKYMYKIENYTEDRSYYGEAL